MVKKKKKEYLCVAEPCKKKKKKEKSSISASKIPVTPICHGTLSRNFFERFDFVTGGCLKRSKTEKMEKKVKKIGVFLTKKRVRGVGSSHRGV